MSEFCSGRFGAGPALSREAPNAHVGLVAADIFLGVLDGDIGADLGKSYGS